MSEYVDRGGYVDRVAAWFGIGDLDFRLTRGDRRRILLASMAPALVVAINVILLLLQVFKDIPYFDFRSEDPSAFPDYSSAWWSLYAVATTSNRFLLPLAITFLVLFSAYPVNRAQGSVAVVITVILINLAIITGAVSILPFLFYEPADSTLQFDWYIENWSTIARDTAILAGGYAFLSFRGLSVRQLPRGRRVRIPPSQPREL